MNRTQSGAASSTSKRWSYSSQQSGLRARATEMLELYRMARRGQEWKVAFTLETFRNTQKRVSELTGAVIENRKVLDIGPGQQLRQMRCFAIRNDVVGIDMDIIPQRFKISDYLKMLQDNGAIRVLKTIARKGIGADSRFDELLAKELGVAKFGELPVHRMNACKMTFGDGEFDFVCSYSAFEHIDDPASALREIARVLKPAGIAYISIHNYTSHSGQHDPKMLNEEIPQEPYWAHLRPAYQDTVHPSTYLNKVTIPAWKRMFDEIMPGVKYVNERLDQHLAEPLEKLRAGGELTEYSDEELLTLNFVAVWKKPAGARAAS